MYTSQNFKKKNTYCIYRVIHKSLQDFRRLRYSSRDGQPKGKYVTAPTQQKIWRGSLPTDMFLSAVSVLVVAQLGSEVPEGLMNYPVLFQSK